MSLALVFSRAKCGIQAPAVSVETHISGGLPALTIVGLPETAVRESKDRVRSAIINSHFEFPSQRITINLAPADLPKEGGRFDLPIAIGILAASGQVPQSLLAETEFIGELALDGSLRRIDGSLSAAIASQRQQRALIVPQDNAEEAALNPMSRIYGASTLLQICAHLHARAPLAPHRAQPRPPPPAPSQDLSEVRGQAGAKRALEIAAAGGHNLLFCGPPGSGKTMLASRLPGILPALSDQEFLEVVAVHSLGKTGGDHWGCRQRPFRAPHHTASAIALVGGGNHPRPGEISLAHHGVLFLDELPEYPRKVLEVLREPLESGEILIARASYQTTFPARFQLVAAQNPCPCGFYGDPDQDCRCSPDQVRRYRDRVSAPLLDRIDLQLCVQRQAIRLLEPGSKEESSLQVRARVELARARQLQRQGCCNAMLSGALLDQHCRLSTPLQRFLQQAGERLQLSARGYYRILRVARSIADLDAAPLILQPHLAEALGYRALNAGA